jgi:hypothetical protein
MSRVFSSLALSISLTLLGLICAGVLLSGPSNVTQVSASSSTGDMLQHCMSVTDETTRLACYDKAIARPPAKGPLASASNPPSRLATTIKSKPCLNYTFGQKRTSMLRSKSAVIAQLRTGDIVPVGRYDF